MVKKCDYCNFYIFYLIYFITGTAQDDPWEEGERDGHKCDYSAPPTMSARAGAVTDTDRNNHQ